MRLFVYGVLIKELAQGRAAELVAALDAGLPATTRGALYAVEGADGGWYPLLLPDPEGGEVHGVVHEAGTVEWQAMDAFEDAHDGPGAEYRRETIPAMLPNALVVDAQAYCYARKVPADAVRIEGGNFAEWLAETDRKPIALR
ncbi:gamma-glutamylcyclotransferase family protein [Aurantiacibacter poecillastricola]|uniref:gamma-glutamylcyclotransferase family protein n=1 Tax=Aurantiacibacter poecillastricola TaxID=3064385 RepID=UPI00273E5310|nr:gamma-glutamylcyclotransferase family protein [Aurantiacibacter sp. 219JJ12-13]MDP5260346.1 gamma-glutamylcyclotransferase family protein [Aurantiacibacter sp. 219JJ12-13]